MKHSIGPPPIMFLIKKYSMLFFWMVVALTLSFLPIFPFAPFFAGFISPALSSISIISSISSLRISFSSSSSMTLFFSGAFFIINFSNLSCFSFSASSNTGSMAWYSISSMLLVLYMCIKTEPRVEYIKLGSVSSFSSMGNIE